MAYAPTDMFGLQQKSIDWLVDFLCMQESINHFNQLGL